MFKIAGLVLVLASCIITPAVFAQIDSPKSANRIFDLQLQQSPITLGTGMQYISGTGIRLSGPYTSGTASYTGVDAPLAVNNVVPSWNVDLPAGTGIRTEVHAVNGVNNTAWYEVARIGTIPGGIPSTKSDGNGYIDADTLMLNSPWPRIEYRIILYTNTVGVTPTLRLMSLCYADTGTRIIYTAPPNPGVQTSLPVPWRSQYWVPNIGGSICGPTSLSMAQDYLGVDLPTETVAADAYDSLNGIYGNWPFLAQAAAKHGLRSYVIRCNSQQPIRDEIAAGHPVILSVKWDRNELTNAPITSTGGHLILCVGITATGDYIINDPAGSSSTWDHVIYNKDQMAHCWLYHGGGVAIPIIPNRVYGRYPYYPYKSTDPVVTGTNGQMEIFAKGADGAVYHMWQTSPNGTWSAWTSLAGTAASDPVAVTNDTGGNSVFARFTDGYLYYCAQNGPNGAWSGWTSLGGPIVGKPSVGKSPDGRLDVFCAMPNGSIQHRWEGISGDWQPWVACMGGVSDPVVALDWDGREEVFARSNTDSSLYNIWQLNNGSWSGLARISGVGASGSAIGKFSDGRIEVYSRYSDDTIRHNWQMTMNVGTTAGVNWNGWNVFSGYSDYGLAVGRTPAGIQEIYYRANTGQIYRSYQTSVDGGWSAWESLGGSAIGAPIVGHNDDGRLQVFIVQADGKMWSKWQQTSGGWSGWSALGSAIFLENVPPTISSVSVSASLAAAGDSIRITARVTDNTGVASVTANGISFTDGGNGTWSGTIQAGSAIGWHTIQITAADIFGNIAADTSSAYRTCQVVALNNRAIWDNITGTASSGFLFALCGEVAVQNSGQFTIDDGSGKPITVYASQHGLTTGHYARVRGILTKSSPTDAHIDSALEFIKPLN